MKLIYNNQHTNCWDYMNCSESTRKKCWAYRLNLGLECWQIRKKARDSKNWNNNRQCINCKFYDLLNNKFGIKKNHEYY